jgi:transcriptional regulator with XRE-family HTH domain
MRKKRKRSSTLDNHWGKRLQSILTERSITVREAGRICQVSPSVISGWLKGNSPADLVIIKRLSEYLDVSFSWLLTGSYEKAAKMPSLSELFSEQQYFDGYARIRIDRLVPRKGDSSE